MMPNSDKLNIPQFGNQKSTLKFKGKDEAWNQLTATLADTIKETSSPNPIPVLKILTALLQSDLDNGIILKNVSSDIERSLKAPLRAGMKLLRDAQNHPAESDRQKTLIDEARLKFIDASLVDYPPENAKAAEYVGICYELLGDKKNALEWYTDAYTTGRSNQSRLKSEFQGATLPMVLVVFWFASLGLYNPNPGAKSYLEKLIKLYNSEKQLDRVATYLSKVGVSAPPYDNHFAKGSELDFSVGGRKNGGTVYARYIDTSNTNHRVEIAFISDLISLGVDTRALTRGDF